MVLGSPWHRELVIVAVGTLAALLVGWRIEAPGIALLVWLAAYLIWTQYHLIRLHIWLRGGREGEFPPSFGLWGEASSAINQLARLSRKSERKLAQVLEGFQESMTALPDATVVLNKRLEAEWWNPVSEPLLGLGRVGEGGPRIEEVIQREDFSAFLQAGDYEQVLEIPSPVDPERLLAVRIVPYARGKMLLQARDVTRVRLLEQVRRDFVANASHELRTPLTVMLGYLETMEESEDVRTSRWHHAIAQMLKQTARMKNIIEDMLTLSIIESGSRVQSAQFIDIPALLESVREEAMVLSGERGHRINLMVEPGSYLQGNLQDLRSIFTNLVSNAVRYTPAGGDIQLRWWLDAEGAHFSVKDTGVGIATEHIPRLTERFYRVDKARSRESGGTGLGLAIVKHALGTLGGSLEIHSQLNQGSTFICHFPGRNFILDTLED